MSGAVRFLLILLLLFPSLPMAGHSATGQKMPDIVGKLDRQDGLMAVFLDKPGGRVLALLPKPDADGVAGRYLYQAYLRSGLGSTPVGLDRSQGAEAKVLAFRQVGGKIFAEFENTQFIAKNGSPDEKTAVAQSFVRALVWSTDIMAQDPEGRLLIDLTGFLKRDAMEIPDALKRAHQGSFKPVAELSAVDVAATRNFPENLELDVYQSFSGDEPGAELRGIAEAPKSLTLIVHHSLIKLPDPGFQPRLYDPRIGVFNQVVTDFSAPLAAPVVYRLADRWRLEKTDPTAARSTVKKPIVFYVDRAAPEPVRSALLEGARWWQAAFEAAGFIDAFKVEILPQGVSPLDARYSVINWVHRQTRGWSYGQSIVDPRTGEIVRGNVLLGSLRVRQDRMIFEGLVGAGKTGSGDADDPIRLSLARLRQLAVHEVGHALGLQHNFAGSSYGDRASVMDYPPPRIKITRGDIDLTDAYAVGVGSWDRHVIGWLYGQIPPGVDEATLLDQVARDGLQAGLKFVTDDDSRPAGGAHPQGALWDDGPDPVESLRQIMQVRRIALDRFGLRNLPAHAPTTDLQRVLVPIYLLHRYELDAAAKSIGGVDFGYPVAGDQHEAAQLVDPKIQRDALKALLETLDPAQLDLPDSLLDLLSSAQSGESDRQFAVEVLPGATGPLFDLAAAAQVSADLTIANLLHPDRLNRLTESHRRVQDSPSVGEIVDALISTAFTIPSHRPARQAEIARRIQARVIAQLAAVQFNPRLAPSAAAIIDARLRQLAVALQAATGDDPEDRAQNAYFAALLLDHGGDARKALIESVKNAPPPPPGMPIGEDDD